MSLSRRLLSNLSSALLALLLAVIVWVVAVYQKAPPRTDVFPTAIPIAYANLSESLLFGAPLQTDVQIRLRGLASVWEQLKTSSFEATVELDGLAPGQHDLPVVVRALERGITIVEVEPSRVTVVLEQSGERRVRVRVKVLDEESIPLGYVSRVPVVVPEQVTISGPQSRVAQVAEAVMEVSLRNTRDTVVKQDAPILMDAAGNRIQGLTISPARVSVTVAVERQVGYRDVTVRANTSGSPAAGYWTSSISVEPTLVTVYGQQSAIDQLPAYVDAETIDIEGAKQDVIRRVALTLPEGILVLGQGAGREGILVQIRVQPLLGGQTVKRELKLQGLRLGLKATASPSTVDIILSGPLPSLQELQPDDVEVILDLAGLGRGIYKVTPRVTLPVGQGLEVKTIVPDTVEITIE